MAQTNQKKKKKVINLEKQIQRRFWMLGGCCTPAPWEPKYLCSELFWISPYIPPHLAIHLYPL